MSLLTQSSRILIDEDEEVIHAAHSTSLLFMMSYMATHAPKNIPRTLIWKRVKSCFAS